MKILEAFSDEESVEEDFLRRLKILYSYKIPMLDIPLEEQLSVQSFYYNLGLKDEEKYGQGKMWRDFLNYEKNSASDKKSDIVDFAEESYRAGRLVYRESNTKERKPDNPLDHRQIIKK